jgi:hypothetical protein
VKTSATGSQVFAGKSKFNTFIRYMQITAVQLTIVNTATLKSLNVYCTGISSATSAPTRTISSLHGREKFKNFHAIINFNVFKDKKNNLKGQSHEKVCEIMT